MFKKLLASLLSVLCLFSIVGVNVSAERKSLSTSNVEIDGLKFYAGEQIEPIKVSIRNPIGTVENYDNFPITNIFNSDQIALYYAYIDKGTNELKFIGSGDSLEKGESYSIVIPFDADPERIRVLNNEEVAFESTNLKYDNNKYYFDKDEGTIPVMAYTFVCKEKIDVINIKGDVNLNANKKMTNIGEIEAAEDVKNAIAIGAVMYLDADAFEEKDLETNIDDVISKDLILVSGKRYYIAIAVVLKDSNAFISDDAKVVINGSFELDRVLDAAISKIDEACIFMKQFIANENTKNTDLEYTVGETYAWTITNSQDQDVSGGVLNILTGKVADAVDEINVKVTDWKLKYGNTLQISVNSKNEWAMKDQSDGSDRNGSYSIFVKEGEAVTEKAWKDNPVLLKVKADDTGTKTATGIFEWEDGVAPTKAGAYRDTLTFTAEIKQPNPPKKGEAITINGDENGRSYKVLDVNGNEATLIAVYDVKDGSTLSDGKNMTFVRGTKQVAYAGYFGSSFDKYLNETFYKSLKFNDAILPKNIICSYFESGSDSDYDVKIASNCLKIYISEPEQRYIYPCDISEVLTYIGKEVSNPQVFDIFLPGSVGSEWYSTRSNCYNTYYGAIQSTASTFTCFTMRNNREPVRPMFVVDTSMIEWEAVE